MPKTQALIGSPGRELPARLRLDVALLPVARSRCRPASTPTTTTSSATRRRRAATASSTTRTTCRSGCSGRLPHDPHRQDAERLRHRDERDLRPAGLGPVQRRQRGLEGRVLRLHQARPPPTPTSPSTRTASLKPYTPDDYQTNVYGGPRGRPDRQPLHEPSNDPLYMQVQFFAPHDPATPETKYQNAFATTPAADRRELQREERQGQARLDPEDQPLRARADREDPDPLPAPPRDAALGRRRGRADRQRVCGQGASSATPI